MVWAKRAGIALVLLALFGVGLLIYPIVILICVVVGFMTLDKGPRQQRIMDSWFWRHTPGLRSGTARSGALILIGWAVLSGVTGYAFYSWSNGQAAARAALADHHHATATARIVAVEARQTSTAVAYARETVTALQRQYATATVVTRHKRATVVAIVSATARASQRIHAQATARARPRITAQARAQATTVALAKAHADATRGTIAIAREWVDTVHTDATSYFAGTKEVRQATIDFLNGKDGTATVEFLRAKRDFSEGRIDFSSMTPPAGYGHVNMLLNQAFHEAYRGAVECANGSAAGNRSIVNDGATSLIAATKLYGQAAKEFSSLQKKSSF